MSVTTFQPGTSETYALQSAIGAYTDEAYTNARKLSGTAIVSGNPQIDTSTETFIGQMRWYKPINPTINVASLTTATNGTKTHYDSDYLSYIKTVRTHGAEKVNMAQVVTQQDGLAKIGRDFAETKSQDEHNAILAVLKGVAISEALVGVTGSGGQTFDTDPTSTSYGFYVDLGASPLVAQPGASFATPQTAGTNPAQMGAVRAMGFLEALGKAYKDYEPEYAYLVTSPEVMASFRSANLVDSTTITEGNVNFNTLFGGKFRIIQTRASQGLTAAEKTILNAAGTSDIVGSKTSFIVLPGALAFEPLTVPDSTEIYRDANTYNGGGSTSIWYRWGYILHPAGYNWAGPTTAFPSDADYMKVWDTTPVPDAFVALVDATGATTTKGIWERKSSSVLSLGVLPIFHS